MNVHNKFWLELSSGITPEGKELHSINSRMGLMEKVRKPTRGAHLLDLFLTDIVSGITCRVLPRIGDHHSVVLRLSFKVTYQEAHARTHWQYNKANWHRMCKLLSSTDWGTFFFDLGATDAAQKFTTFLSEYVAKFIPKQEVMIHKQSHPWLDDNCVQLIQAKHRAEGSPQYIEMSRACSKGLLQQY